MKLKTQTDESIIHVQEQTGEMQRHRQRLFLLVCSSDTVSIFPSPRVERESFSR